MDIVRSIKRVFSSVRNLYQRFRSFMISLHIFSALMTLYIVLIRLFNSHTIHINLYYIIIHIFN